MNRKQLILLVMVALALGALGLFFSRRDHASYQTGSARMGEKLLPTLPINDIVEIKIKQHTNSVTLAQKGETWVVTERSDYPANFSEISDFLKKIMELKVTQPIAVTSASSLPRLDLASNSLTAIEFKEKSGRSVPPLLLGKKHLREGGGGGFSGGGFPDGRFVMVGNDLHTVSLVAEPFSSAEPKAENWLLKDFFKVERVRIISLTATNATNSWKISRDSETNDWKLAQQAATEALDAGKVSGLAGSLSSPTFADVVTQPKPAETGLDHPTLLDLETFDGLVYRLKIGNKSGEVNYFVSINVSGSPEKARMPGKDEKPDEKEKLDKEFRDKAGKLAEKLKQEQRFNSWTYLVPKWTLDPLLKDRAQLLVEKKEEPKDKPPGQAPIPSALTPPPK